MPPEDTQPTPQPQPTPMPEQPAPQPEAPVQPSAQAPLSPLYQTDLWYLPDGHFGVFGYREAVGVVYPGWLILYKKSDHTELKRIALAGDLQMKSLLNYARIAQVGGQKFSVFNQNHVFYTMQPAWPYGVFAVGVLLNLINSLLRLSYDEAANFGLSAIALLFMIAAFGWMATSIPKAKAFVAACKHGAGIAQ